MTTTTITTTIPELFIVGRKIPPRTRQPHHEVFEVDWSGEVIEGRRAAEFELQLAREEDPGEPWVLFTVAEAGDPR